MPLDEIEIDPNSPLEKSLRKSGAGIETTKAETGPVYKKVGSSKIPVSKHMGNLWCARKDQGLKSREKAELCWNEALRYYDNDQMSHRTSRDNSSGNTPYGQRLNNEFTETENLVFANCSIMVPMLYAKNPHVTFTSDNDANLGLCKVLERLMNKLMHMKNAPGLNFKPKARRVVLTALLTNRGFIKIGWTDKDDSNETAMQQLQELAKELETAKSKKEIKAVEGKIMALEERIGMLSPQGPWTRHVMPQRIVVDPTSAEADLSDANWIMEWEYLPTDYLNAVYASEGDPKRSVYEPTHVMLTSTTNEGIDDVVNNFRLIPNDGELKAATYGYANEEALQAASHTKIWYVWDKTTRRVMMFADNNWQWPIWVWDDPLQLPRFFPYFALGFHESPNSNAPKGEVTYYLDQQDAINEINTEVQRSRRWARRNLFFNKNVISQNDVEQVLKGDDGTARGVDVPEGMKINDCIESVTPPAIRMPELFNVDSKLAAINRITGINDSMRGAQFKTNTTNKAVEAYSQNVDIRVDERIDLIEDFFGDIMWNISMLCLMKWNAQDVGPLVGEMLAAEWKQITDNREFDTLYNARVEGGSIAKPNSKEKKEQAMALGQALGQFASASPAVVIPMIKMIERAFDEVIITDEEWKMIIDSMEMALTKAGSGPGGEAAPEEPVDPNSQPAQTDEQLKEQITAKIQSLPPQAQQMLETLVQQGMPPAEALQEVENQLQSATTS